MSDAIDITGLRVGKLTVLHPGTRKSRFGKYWLCVCDCGEFTERRSCDLRYSKNRGEGPACTACARKRGGRTLKRSYYARLFLNTGRLWSFMSNERLVRNIERALNNEGWRAPAHEVIRLPVAAYSLLDAIETRERVELPRTVGEKIKRRSDHLERVRIRKEKNYRAQRERDLKAYAEWRAQRGDLYGSRL